MIKAVCWGVLVLILLAAVILALYIAGMTLYFHYQLKDGRIKREYTEEQRRADEEQIQAIREMQARKEEKRQKRRQIIQNVHHADDCFLHFFLLCVDSLLDV